MSVRGRAVSLGEASKSWTCVVDPSGQYAGRLLKAAGFLETLQAGYLPPGSIWHHDGRFQQVVGNEATWPDGKLVPQSLKLAHKVEPLPRYRWLLGYLGYG